MCLVVVAFRATREWPFVLAANRDEQHSRPTSHAGWWPDGLQLLGGRDLRAGGTWLAVDRRGRVAAVTNVRDGKREAAPRSRGSLVAEFVAGDTAAPEYAAATAIDAARFGPFNLLVFDGAELHYASNRAPSVRLDAGVHAYSNSPHGTEWPKVTSARARAADVLGARDPLGGLFELLAERGGGAEADGYRRAHFVVGQEYGTRCSTVLIVDASGNARFVERSFDACGSLVREVTEAFPLEPGARRTREPWQ